MPTYIVFDESNRMLVRVSRDTSMNLTEIQNLVLSLCPLLADGVTARTVDDMQVLNTFKGGGEFEDLASSVTDSMDTLLGSGQMPTLGPSDTFLSESVGSWAAAYKVMEPVRAAFKFPPDLGDLG